MTSATLYTVSVPNMLSNVVTTLYTRTNWQALNGLYYIQQYTLNHMILSIECLLCVYAQLARSWQLFSYTYSLVEIRASI